MLAGGTSTLFGKAGAASREDVRLPAAATKANPLPPGR